MGGQGFGDGWGRERGKGGGWGKERLRIGQAGDRGNFRSELREWKKGKERVRRQQGELN